MRLHGRLERPRAQGSRRGEGRSGELELVGLVLRAGRKEDAADKKV
jgi:hypothetical protein